MAFHPGTLTNANGGSTPAAFSSSVAGSIERKVHDLITAMTGTAPYDMSVDNADARARRILFVAIAQAVFEELRDHASSIELGTGSGDGHTHSVTIHVDEP